MFYFYPYKSSNSVCGWKCVEKVCVRNHFPLQNLLAGTAEKDAIFQGRIQEFCRGGSRTFPKRNHCNRLSGAPPLVGSKRTQKILAKNTSQIAGNGTSQGLSVPLFFPFYFFFYYFIIFGTKAGGSGPHPLDPRLIPNKISIAKW